MIKIVLTTERTKKKCLRAISLHEITNLFSLLLLLKKPRSLSAQKAWQKLCILIAKLLKYSNEWYFVFDQPFETTIILLLSRWYQIWICISSSLSIPRKTIVKVIFVFNAWLNESFDPSRPVRKFGFFNPTACIREVIWNCENFIRRQSFWSLWRHSD